jgi:hypothetical protein
MTKMCADLRARALKWSILETDQSLTRIAVRGNRTKAVPARTATAAEKTRAAWSKPNAYDMTPTPTTGIEIATYITTKKLDATAPRCEAGDLTLIAANPARRLTP